MISEQYLIQQHVRRVYNNIPDLPDKDYKWREAYLGELNNEEFYKGVCDFVSIIKSILNNVKNDPQSWGMRCYEAHNFSFNAPRTAQEKQTDNDLSRIGELFYALGKNGNIIDKSFHIDNTAFKNKKIVKRCYN
jgi:hypothetical protein